MMKYGLLLAMVGTFVCVTAVSPSQPALCPKYVKQVCGTDGLTYNNFCLLDRAHARDAKVVLSHVGSCKNGSIKRLANDIGRMKNKDEVLNKTIETTEDLKYESEEADKDIMQKINDVDDEANEEVIVTEDAGESKIDDVTVNKTNPEALQKEQAHKFVEPIAETNATSETEVKNVNTATNSSNAFENHRKVKIEEKTKSDRKNLTEKNGKSNVIKKSEAIRKRRDVNNLTDNKSNYKGETTNEREFKVSKNKSEKSNKQRNVKNLSNTNDDDVKTNTDGKIEQTHKISKNKSDKSRKRRDVRNENTKHEQNQSGKRIIDSKNSKKKVTKSSKHKATNSSHQSRKQRKGKDGTKHIVQKTKHSKHADSKMKKSSQNS